MAKKSESYEAMMEKLKSILQQMEEGNISLDDSIKLYEDGIKLSNKLFKTLKTAEEKIKVLEDPEGEVMDQ